MMKRGIEPIFWVKVVHTGLWAVMAVGVFYILYSGISGDINVLTYVSLGLLTIEILMLVAFGWACPLTILAKKVKPDWQNGDDMFLPVWLAIHNKTVFGTLLVIGVVLVVYRLVV